MSRITLAAAISALLFITPSCSESEASSAAGTYTLDIKPTLDGALEAESAGKEVPAAKRTAMETMLKGMFEKTNFNLNADLTCSGDSEMSIMGMTTKSTTKGTWSIDSGKLTITTTHEDGKEKASTQTGTYSDGKLTIDKDLQGKKFTLHLIKKK